MPPSSVVLVLNLGREIVPDVADVPDLVLHDEGDLGAHGEADLRYRMVELESGCE